MSLVIYSVYAFLRLTLKLVMKGGVAANGTGGFLNGALGVSRAWLAFWCPSGADCEDGPRRRAALDRPAGDRRELADETLWRGGNHPPDTLKLFVMGLPDMIAGTWPGFMLFGKIDEATFRKIVLALLFASAAMLIL